MRSCNCVQRCDTRVERGHAAGLPRSYAVALFAQLLLELRQRRLFGVSAARLSPVLRFERRELVAHSLESALSGGVNAACSSRRRCSR